MSIGSFVRNPFFGSTYNQAGWIRATPKDRANDTRDTVPLFAAMRVLFNQEGG